MYDFDYVIFIAPTKYLNNNNNNNNNNKMVMMPADLPQRSSATAASPLQHISGMFCL
jgi:hypothetical protein